jgi:hypothetical protein
MAKKTKTPKTETATSPAPVAIDPTPVVPVEEPKKLETVESKDQKPAETRNNIKAAKSTVANPVQVVHGLVAEMVKANPQVRRRDLVEAAIKAGCAYYTARTQVQVALKKMKAAAAA